MSTCLATFGFKACVLELGHASMHTSRSGSCWPAEPDGLHPMESFAQDGVRYVRAKPWKDPTQEDVLAMCEKLRASGIDPAVDGFYRARLTPDAPPEGIPLTPELIASLPKRGE